MSATIAPSLTLPELARMMQAAIKDRSYQQQTRLGSAVRDYLAWKRLRASARTLDIYEGYLARLATHRDIAAEDPDVHEVTSQMLLEALSEYPRGSYRLVKTSYSDFFAWACRWGRCEKNPVDLLPPMPEPPMKVYKIFSKAEQTLIKTAAERLPLPWIQRARVLVLLDLGVRSGEARAMRLQDFDMAERVVVVSGKGSKERVVPLSNELWKAMMQVRSRPIPAALEQGNRRVERLPAGGDYLFFPYDLNGGRVVRASPEKPMSDRTIRTWWAGKVIPEAGVEYRSLHMARHTVGTDLASAEADSFTIRDWLGHADVSTTQVYVHNSRSRLLRGLGKLDEYRKVQGE